MASAVVAVVTYFLCFFLTISLSYANDPVAGNSAFLADDSVHPLPRESNYARKDICPQIIDWLPLSEAITLEGEKVTIFQGAFGWGKQYFYSVRCDPSCEGQPCMQMKAGVQSRCETRYNLIPAIVADEEAGDVAWKMIRVPGQCVCAELIEKSSVHENKANVLDITKLFHG